AAPKDGVFKISRVSRNLCAGRRHGDQAFALQALARQLTSAANGFSLLPNLLFRRLFVIVAQLHFAEDAFALQFLLQGAQRLVHIVIANDYLQRSTAPSKPGNWDSIKASWPQNHAARPAAADLGGGGYSSRHSACPYQSMKPKRPGQSDENPQAPCRPFSSRLPLLSKI